MKNYLFISIMTILHCVAIGQCDAVLNSPQSARLANYKMALTLDHKAKKATGTQTITFKNQSPDTILELRMYMYLNGFKNTYSTWIKGAEGNTFGQNLMDRKPEDWGWIELLSIEDDKGRDLSKNKKYIHPDDDNKDDETVLMIPLISPIMPGETVEYKTTFESRLPRTIARSGWGHNDFFLWVHWYPKLGVWEKDLSGKWGWNCHQFMRQTEFYGEFGVYNVELTTSDHLVIGASGCLVSDTNNGDGTHTKIYHAEDVIDFAWTAYPHFEVVKDQWKHVEITMLSPKEHRTLQPRFMKVLKQSLEYLEVHVGTYPYSTITIMDPPLVGLRNGFMEYPTFSTGGSFYGFPKGIRTIESLIVHEFAHQYFMGILANNEKEEPWLDEGFVTYFEDRIMEEYYGKKRSLIDLWGFKIGNSELTRAEYTGMDNHREAIVAQPGWKFKRYTKELVYSKTGTTLQSIRKMYGQETMDVLMHTYFEKYKFTHPRANDFLSTTEAVITQRHGEENGKIVKNLLHQALYTTAVCDYAVKTLRSSQIRTVQGATGIRGIDIRKSNLKGIITVVQVERKGDFITPVEVEITMDSGEKIIKYWSGEEYVKEYVVDGKAIAVHIDP
ncbi:MAG: M1 family metallopeptidase, partial [Saprospiraceae bacterium]